MASSCHLSMDLLCQEMRDACWGSSESLGSPRSLCLEWQEGRRRCSDAQVPPFNVRPGLHAGYTVVVVVVVVMVVSITHNFQPVHNASSLT